MINEYESKKCCNKNMDLITSYYVPDSEGNDAIYFIFQCKKCGKIIDCDCSDLKEFSK